MYRYALFHIRITQWTFNPCKLDLYAVLETLNTHHPMALQYVLEEWSPQHTQNTRMSITCGGANICAAFFDGFIRRYTFTSSFFVCAGCPPCSKRDSKLVFPASKYLFPKYRLGTLGCKYETSSEIPSIVHSETSSHTWIYKKLNITSTNKKWIKKWGKYTYTHTYIYTYKHIFIENEHGIAAIDQTLQQNIMLRKYHKQKHSKCRLSTIWQDNGPHNVSMHIIGKPTIHKDTR